MTPLMELFQHLQDQSSWHPPFTVSVNEISPLSFGPSPLIISNSSGGKDSSTTTTSPSPWQWLSHRESEAKRESRRPLKVLPSEPLHWPADYLLSLLSILPDVP